jgi:hypothetical protein
MPGCPPGLTCGGGGQPGICGATDLAMGCMPRTCAQQGIQCGPAGDGCGGLLQCGSCPAGQTCGGGGTPGVCGGGCVPRTCMQANANCGQLGDGCGGIIDCGMCTPPYICGVTGQANTCGVVN